MEVHTPCLTKPFTIISLKPYNIQYHLIRLIKRNVLALLAFSFSLSISLSLWYWVGNNAVQLNLPTNVIRNSFGIPLFGATHPFGGIFGLMMCSLNCFGVNCVWKFVSVFYPHNNIHNVWLSIDIMHAMRWR